MTYSVKISPVQKNQSTVVRYITRILGSQKAEKAIELVKEGGVVSNYLSKDDADQLAKDLRNFGAIVEILESKDPIKENEYQLILLDAGSRQIEVVKVIRELIGKSLSEGKELVDNLGLIGSYETKEEAENIKNLLTGAGAKVHIKQNNNPLGDPSESVKFAAKINGKPAEFTINLVGDVTGVNRINDLTISTGNDMDTTMNSLFTFSVSDVDKTKLEGLTIVLKYKF